MTDEDRKSIVGLGSEIVSGLGTSPLLLALVVLNIFSVGGILWSVFQERKLEAHATEAAHDLIGDIAKLLAECQHRNS